MTKVCPASRTPPQTDMPRWGMPWQFGLELDYHFQTSIYWGAFMHSILLKLVQHSPKWLATVKLQQNKNYQELANRSEGFHTDVMSSAEKVA